MKKGNELKNIVKEKYAEIAIKSQQSGCKCCGGSETDPAYTVFNESYNEQQGYVDDADLGLGCGLPTEHANLKSGDSVLDLGSGAGNDCFVARSIVGNSGTVVGLDFTEEMLSKARLNNQKMGYENIEFIMGDIEQIPMPDDSFDVVISNCVLNLVPDKEKAFAEIRRVLKPGGHFCVSDIVLQGELPDQIRDAATLYAGCVSGALQKEDYIQVIHNNGFINIEIKKDRSIQVPDELFLNHISVNELDQYKQSGTGIFSITVRGYK